MVVGRSSTGSRAEGSGSCGRRRALLAARQVVPVGAHHAATSVRCAIPPNRPAAGCRDRSATSSANDALGLGDRRQIGGAERPRLRSRNTALVSERRRSVGDQGSRSRVAEPHRDRGAIDSCLGVSAEHSSVDGRGPCIAASGRHSTMQERWVSARRPRSIGRRGTRLHVRRSSHRPRSTWNAAWAQPV